MTITVEEGVAVVAMVLWGVTTDALLGLSGRRTAATSPPQARRQRGEKEALQATSSEGVEWAKGRTTWTPRPRRFVSYLRLVYGWFEVMCDFVVAIFEHMLSMPTELFVDGRLPAHRSAPVYRRLCLAEVNVHRRGTDGHPALWVSASSRGKTCGAPNLGMMFYYGMMAWTRRQHLQDRCAAIFMTWASRVRAKLHIHRLTEQGCKRARTRRLRRTFNLWVDNTLQGASCASKRLASRLVCRRTRTAMLQCVKRWQRVTTVVHHCRRWKLRQRKKSLIQQQHAVLEAWKTHTLAHAGAVREELKYRARQRRASCTSVLQLWRCVAAYGKCQRHQLARVIDVVKARHCVLCVCAAARSSFSAWRLLALKWQRPRDSRTCPALVALERAPHRCLREEGPREKSSHRIIPYTPPPIPYTEGDTNPDTEVVLEGKGFGLEVVPGAQTVDGWCEGGAREMAVSPCSLPPSLSPTPSPLALSLSLALSPSPSPSPSSVPPQLEGAPVMGERATHFRTDCVGQGAAKGPDNVGEGTANGADNTSDHTEEQSLGCRMAEMRALTSAVVEGEAASRLMCAAMAASKEEVTFLWREIEAQGSAHAATVSGMEAKMEAREVEVACMRREIEAARREAAEKCAALAVANALVVEQVTNSQE